MILQSNLYPEIYRRLAAAGCPARSESIGDAPSVLMCDGSPELVQSIIDGFTVDEAKAERRAESTAHAKTLRDRVVSTVSAGEMASWPIKRAEAMAYSQSGNPADAPMLSAEAAARGVTLPAIIARVAANATMFAGLESAISGADGRHRDAIDALASFEAVAAYDLTARWPAV